MQNITKLLNYSYFIINALVSLGFLIKGPPLLIANTAATTVFFLGVILFEKLTPFKLKNYIRLLVIITLISHSLFGEYFRAYYTTKYFDNMLHLFGSFAFALFAFEILKAYLIIQASRPQILKFLLVSALGISLGTFFELIEFALDYFLNQRNQFGLLDTNLDLLFNIIGSCLAGLFLVVKEK